MEFICTFELKQDKSDIQKNEKEMTIWHSIVMLVPLYSPAKHYDTRLIPWKPESSLSLPSLISLLLLLLLALISASFLIIINKYHFNTYFLTIFFFQFNDIVNVIFSSKPFVAGLVAYGLDNTIQRHDARRDRGYHFWERFRSFKSDTRSEEFYSLPFNMDKYFPSF